MSTIETATAFERNLLDRRSVTDLRQELADIAALYPREVLVAAIVAARVHQLGQRPPAAVAVQAAAPRWHDDADDDP